jgi:mono/diheme cytochrome c family protein
MSMSTEVHPLDLLEWDQVLKEQSPLPGSPTADFIFKVKNPSAMDVVISDVKTSCGCTVAKLPSKPWTLAPGTNGEIAVTVNLAGKFGTFYKTITVLSTNASKLLTIKINLPQSPAMVRTLNQQLAMADPTRIFKDDCRKCHFDVAKDPTGNPLMGKQLYVAVCGVCHEARPRATMVSDLHALTHPTDYAFWKQIITDGKPKSIMPGGAVAHGGPLSDAQIESLAKVMTEEFPSAPPTATATGPMSNTGQPSKN